MVANLAKSFFALVLALLVQEAAAQNLPSPVSTPAATSAQAQQLLKPEELDQLVSPIALYPDTLLANVLMASTYPLEVVEAGRWVDGHKNLKGEELKAAVEKQGWDDSVKQLTATPSALNAMSNNISWMQKLGDAVLAQQDDVMAAVQSLRAKAQANNKLESTKEQIVTVKNEQSKRVIAIEPSDPSTIYVPYYDPGVVYGAWDYPAYPPYSFPMDPGYYYGDGAYLGAGLAFGAGFALGAWAGNNGYWGGGINWGGNTININRPINGNHVSHWTHNPAHRQGVRYGNNNVANKFNRAGNAQNRAQHAMGQNGKNSGHRNRDNQRQNLGSNNQRQGAGNRAGNNQRANAANRGGSQHKNTANRSGNHRQNANANRNHQRQNVSRRSNNPQRHTANRGSGHQFSNVGAAARNARAQSPRHASTGGGGRAGGSAARGGRGGGGGGRGGGRRSDIQLKHDIVLLGRFKNGLGFYRFSYNGSSKAYVGVIAQEVQAVVPDAVFRGRDGYLRVQYDKLGLKFQTYDHWIKSHVR